MFRNAQAPTNSTRLRVKPSLLRSFLLVLLVLPAIGDLSANPGDEAKTGTGPAGTTAWKKVASGGGVVISSRLRAGSALEEFRAVGVVEAAPGRVFAVVDDTEAYPSFMPYTSECRILQRSAHGTVTYQRLDLPLVSDRDYTLRCENARAEGPAGASYRVHWEEANELGPAPKPGVQRVELCEGGWIIEPAGANKSRLTYTVYSDSGGHIPAWIADTGSKTAIRKIFAAIRKQVREPKYDESEG